MHAELLFKATGPLACRAVRGVERLGEPSRFEVEVVSPDPIDRSALQALVGAPGAVRLHNAFGERLVHGVFTEVTRVVTANPGPGRIHRFTLESSVHLLSHRRRSRVFQHLTVPAIVRQVLEEGGWAPEALAVRTTETHAERRYLVQYDETDLDFVRRLCEEEGLFYRFEAGEHGEQLLLEDGETPAPPAFDGALPLTDASGLASGRPVASDAMESRVRRPGKARVRDHDPANPSLALEGLAALGSDAESVFEVYAAPGRFRTPAEGESRARRLLESLRADSLLVRFSSSALALAPGLAVTLERAPDFTDSASPEGAFRVIAVEHDFRDGEPRAPRITAVPDSQRHRLERRTPRPRIHGVHPAVVTGAPGTEIHTDDEGHVNVRFFWDREGPVDHQSSLPVRVLQHNLPGPMLIPRVGWEVAVAFEDGDPDRPYVLGRVYNGKQPPPFALPANKTITRLGTVSSPGGSRQNSVHYDDARGRQNLAWVAGFGKTTTVGNTMLTQTIGFEKTDVGGAQRWTIGGNQTISVADASIHQLGSQTASVGAVQDISIKGNSFVKVGSETVLVGGALIELVGSPGDAFGTLSKEGLLAVAGELSHGVIPIAYGIYQGVKDVASVYEHSGGDLETTLKAAGQHALTTAESVAGVFGAGVPAFDALMGAIGASKKAPWDDEDVQQARQAAAEAEGAGGPGAKGAGSGGGAGNRETVVNGAMAEVIGGALSVAAPIGVKSTTVGGAALLVGGSNLTRATKVSHLCMGAAIEDAASIAVEAGIIGRNVKGALKLTTGALSIKAGGAYGLKASSLALKVGGALSLSGGTVTFTCGGAELAASPGGVVIKAGVVKVTHVATISGKQAAG